MLCTFFNLNYRSVWIWFAPILSQLLLCPFVSHLKKFRTPILNGDAHSRGASHNTIQIPIHRCEYHPMLQIYVYKYDTQHICCVTFCSYFRWRFTLQFRCGFSMQTTTATYRNYTLDFMCHTAAKKGREYFFSFSLFAKYPTCECVALRFHILDKLTVNFGFCFVWNWLTPETNKPKIEINKTHRNWKLKNK